MLRRRSAPPTTLPRLALAVSAGVLSFSGLANTPAAVAQTDNPSWSGRCPLRIALLVDHSESMQPHLAAAHRAAQDLVDALRGARNLVGVVRFGTSANVDLPLTDVSDDDERRALKRSIEALPLLIGNEGGTNWEAALAVTESLSPDLVVLVTDGVPTAFGIPPVSSESDPMAAVGAAADVADRLQAAGVRTVGVGIGLPTGAERNLAAVTGPRPNDDYYAQGIDRLLPALYDVAAKSCGVAVAALPQPEPRSLSMTTLVVGGLLAVCAVVAAGLLVSRRRGSLTPVAVSGPSPTLADPSITLEDLPPRSSAATSVVQGGEERAGGEVTQGPSAGGQTMRRPPRRISLGPPPTQGPPSAT